jgi:hypothetical protein
MDGPAPAFDSFEINFFFFSGMVLSPNGVRLCL